MWIWQDLEAEAADRMVDAGVVIRQFFGVEDMISVDTVGEVIIREIRSVTKRVSCYQPHLTNGSSHPESIISSSIPYSFMCCKPHPSFILLGIHFFLRPVRLGVWNIRISTRSGPYFDTNEASNEAHDGFGVSRVPLRASVRMDTCNCGLSPSA